MTDDDNASVQSAEIDAAWTDNFRFVQPANPAFWLYCVLGAIGTFTLVSTAAPLTHTLMPTMVLGLLLWGLYVIPWVWLIHHRDRFSRSTGKVALVGFGWGAMIATWVIALPGNAAVFSILGKTKGADFTATWGAAISAPLVEESAKAAGIVILAILATNHLRNAYDGLVLGAIVGLGFQVAEDWYYGLSAAAGTFGRDQVQAAFGNFFARGLLAGAASHALYSGLVGAGIGWWIQHKRDAVAVRLKGTLPLVAAGVGLHSLWDYVASVGLRLLIPLIIVFVTILITLVGRWTDRQLRPWVRNLLAPQVTNGLVADAELDALVGSPKDRRHHIKSVKARGGKAAGKAAKNILDAEFDLIEALATSRGVRDESVQLAEGEIARLREVANATS